MPRSRPAFPLTRDLNGRQQEGVGYSQMSRNGRFRGSTARTFLAQAKGRPNLRVETKAFATRLLFEGKRCSGVAFRQKGQDRQVTAAREVILSGGTINSPHLLQVSGVGPGAHLKSIGVDVVHDLPGVGANLSDHYAIRISHRVKDAVSINELSRGLRLGARDRPLADDGARRADLRRVQRASVRPQPRGAGEPRYPAAVLAGELRPEQVRRAGARARHDDRGQHRPAREPRHDHGQVARSVRAPVAQAQLSVGAQRPARLARRHRACAPHLRRAGAGAAQRRARSRPAPTSPREQALADYIRQQGTTIYHIVGTCKMGEDPMAVVDARLRVRGLDGLRVIDASVMPTVTTANTNAPTIMIAEKGAAMIRQDAAAG